MKKTIGVLAHVDAGKTTFSEQLLYHAEAIRQPGRVDTQNTVMDTDPVEKQRGITIFSGCARFCYRRSEYCLIDTPGHIDFSAEMERTLSVLDYAVIIVSAAEGIQSHTETVWRLLARRQIPVFFFINKTDRAGADPAGVLSALQKKFSPDILDFSQDITEPVAALDDNLLDYYLETGYDPERWQAAIRRLIRARRLFPCFFGAALRDQGIADFLSALDQYTVTSFDAQAELAGMAYAVRHDARGARVTFLKITAGTLRVKDRLPLPGPDNETPMASIDEIRLYTGRKYVSVQIAEAGDVCAVTGPRSIRPGMAIGAETSVQFSECTPMLTAQVLFDPEVSSRTVLEKLRILEDEDPALNVSWDEHLSAIRVQIMGTVQLEVLEAVFLQRFGFPIHFGECQVLYLETPAREAIGCGHFEPLRHYAEVHLKLTPLPAGSGIQFASSCSLDVLDRNYQNLIRTHIFEKAHKGVLTGAPLTDTRFTLLTGRAHLKHTSGGDFREAVYRAVRQGLFTAGTVLLEPMYDYEITVPAEDLGRVLSDVQKMSGSFDAPENDGSIAVITGKLPVAEAIAYGKSLLSFTKGKGRISTRPAGYAPCHNAQAVIERIGYDKNGDTENTPDSVFCAHGSGFLVKWDAAPAYMHCEIN